MTPRATALPPAERRAHLVDAARTLIASRGKVPSTRDIAEAAGVAEGTIFRVFPSKDDLVGAVVASTFCPAVFRRGLVDVDLDLPLRERLVALVTVLQRRYQDVFEIMGALGLTAPPAFPAGAHDDCTADSGHVGEAMPTGPEQKGTRDQSGEATARELLRFLEPDADRLRCTPIQLLHYLRLLTFSGSHAQLADGVLLTPDEIVDVVLTGVVVPDHTTARPTAGPTVGTTAGPTTRPTDSTPRTPRNRKAR